MCATRVDDDVYGFEDLGHGKIPVEPFISENYFEDEVNFVFKRTWRNVGRVIDDLPNPGDYFVKDFDVPNVSLIIKRDMDGKIHAFHNICRHRGAKLVTEARGNSRHFVCGFHAWAYNEKGRLIGVPDERQFRTLDKSECGLLEVHCDVWNGMIFINLTNGPVETLQDYLGKMGSSIEAFPHEKMIMTGHYESIINCNWKTFWYAFMEAYHVPYVHKHSVKELMETSANPNTNMFDFEFFGRHNAASIPVDPDAPPTDLDRNVRSLADTQMIAASAMMNECTIPVNKSQSRNFMFRITQFFPNFACHMGSGYYYTYNMEPISVDQTRWIHKIYGYPPSSAAARVATYYAKAMFRDALLEDITALEPMHEALKTGVMKEMYYCEQEALLRHHFMKIEEAIERGKRESTQ